jgi:hypothetical protein
MNHYCDMAQNHSSTSRLTSYIEAMIAGGTFAAGDRLPPLRELAEQFGLTPSTARRGLKELCEQDILELRHGSGTYVKAQEARNSDGRTVSVVLFNKNPQTSYCTYAMQRFQLAAAEYNWRLRMFFCNYHNLKPLYDENQFRESDALVLMGCYDTFDLSYLPENLPLIGLEMHTSLHGRLSSVTLDPFDAAELAAEHFKQLGIKHVKVVDARMPVHEIRTAMFCRLWGDDCEVITKHTELELADDHGCLFVSGSGYDDFAQRYKNSHGRDLAESFRVLSIDGKNLILPGYQPANTIAVDWCKAGEAVAEECARRLASPGSSARRIYLAPKLHLYNQNLLSTNDKRNKGKKS